jgi:hypothetical protein
MRPGLALLLSGIIIAATPLACAQDGILIQPKTMEAGNAFSIQSTGNGKATLYIIGPGQVLKRDVHLGETTFFSVGSIYNAGHYLAVIKADNSSVSDSFDVLPASKPAGLSFLAKPSRLQVGLHNGITGAVYIFDSYRNLMAAPMPVSFELSNPTGAEQKHIEVTSYGAASTVMDSTPQQGIDKFAAHIGDISSMRVVEQVPGDPCALKMSAQLTGQKLHLVTAPLRDCAGNAVPDGTIVTFTETYNGDESTVDVPLKHGIAEVQMPATSGATVTVASGVVMGNQIRWEK